jgi:hypothetical protein
VGASDRKYHVVLVKKLRRLARVDFDRVDNGNLRLCERAPQELQDCWVGDKWVDGAGLGEDVVDAPSPVAEKCSLSPGLVIQQRTKRVARFVENRMRKDIPKDDVALGAEFLQRLAARHAYPT